MKVDVEVMRYASTALELPFEEKSTLFFSNLAYDFK